MNRQNSIRPISLEVRALYPLSALARSANVDIDLLRRVLRSNRVQFVRQGRALYVPLSEIRRRIPALWQSLCAADGARVDDSARREGASAHRARQATK